MLGGQKAIDGAVGRCAVAQGIEAGLGPVWRFPDPRINELLGAGDRLIERHCQGDKLNFGCTRQTLAEAIDRLAADPVFTRG